MQRIAYLALIGIMYVFLAVSCVADNAPLPDANIAQLQDELATEQLAFVLAEPEDLVAIDAPQPIRTAQQALAAVRKQVPQSILSTWVTATSGWIKPLSQQSVEAVKKSHPLFVELHPVWIVTLAGSGQVSSGPPGVPRAVANGLNIVIDANTGTYLMSFH